MTKWNKTVLKVIGAHLLGWYSFALAVDKGVFDNYKACCTVTILLGLMSVIGSVVFLVENSFEGD